MHQLEEPFRGARRALQVPPDLRERGEARAHHHGIEHEGRQLSAAHGAAQHVATACVHHGDQAAGEYQYGHGNQEGALADA